MAWLYAYLAISASALLGVASYTSWRRGISRPFDAEDMFSAIVWTLIWPIGFPLALAIGAVCMLWWLAGLPGQVAAAMWRRKKQEDG